MLESRRSNRQKRKYMTE